MDSFLALRGLKTLAVRMRAPLRQRARHRGVPGIAPEGIRRALSGARLASRHRIAARQMSDFGGMVSFQVSSDAAALALVTRTKVFFLAESLGGVESLIEVPGPMTHASVAGSPAGDAR
jgi:cystathionine gamma-synthase